MTINKLLPFLKCPKCQNTDLFFDGHKICCNRCAKKYDVIEGIPIMLDKDSLGEHEISQADDFDKHYSQNKNTEVVLERWQQSMTNRVFKINTNHFINTYLDIGCSAMAYTVFDAAKRGVLSFGVNVSVEAMKQAKKNANLLGVMDNTAFVVASAQNIPFRNNIFDYVSAISVLEHIENDKQAIKSIGSILKEKGRAYICVPNTYKRMWFFLWPIYWYLDKKSGHKRHYSIETLDTEMAENSLVRENVIYNGHLIKLLQLFLDKLNIINDKNWWKMEKKDINSRSLALQLNAIYRKK